MKRLVLFLVTIVSAVAIAEDAPKAPPQITAEQRAQFWRAQAEYLAEQKRMETIGAALDRTIAQMRSACEAAGSTLETSPNGEPVCQARPAKK